MNVTARKYFNGEKYSMYDVKQDLSTGKNVIMTFTDKSNNSCIVCDDTRQSKNAKFCNNCGAKMNNSK